jgi:hypothetical protein
MRYLALISLIVPTIATAQLADIPLIPTGGIYQVKVQAPEDSDMAKICCVRADASPVEELGCVPAGPDAIVTVEVTLTATPNNDAEIRCYAVDTTNLESDLSPNAGIVDFTRPGAPEIFPYDPPVF